MLIEDLGDDLYADVLTNGGDERALYESAAEVLAALHARRRARRCCRPDKPLHAYDETALLAEIDLLTRMVPARRARARGDARMRSPSIARCGATRSAPTREASPVFVHRDYHAQNLIWLPERKGLARVGLIDFQDAVAGTRAYDLISLVEDARRDVSPEIAEATTRRYLAATRRRTTDDDSARQMAVMAAQRNAKIAGIFARLYKRDGKPRYLSYLPRVWGYLNTRSRASGARAA